MDGLQTSLASLSSVGGPVLDTELSYQLIPLQEREREIHGRAHLLRKAHLLKEGVIAEEGALAKKGELAEEGAFTRGGCTC